MEQGVCLGCAGGSKPAAWAVGAKLRDKSAVFPATGLWSGGAVGTGEQPGAIRGAFGAIVSGSAADTGGYGDGLGGVGGFVCF